MATDHNRPAEEQSRRDADRLRWIEVCTAVLLSAAGLCSAWATYQASLWGGIQASHFARANARMTEASRLSLLDGQLVGIDFMMFRSWLDAAADGDEARMALFLHRFTPELRAVFAPWRARCPADMRQCKVAVDAPPVFARPAHAEGIRAIALQKAADAEFARGDRANAIGDRYVAATVVLSLVLFLAGISAVLKQNRLRNMLLGLAALIGVAAVIVIMALPMQSL